MGEKNQFTKLFNFQTENLNFSIQDISELSLSMVDTAITRAQTTGSNIPAIYTYLGQWYDHEITREPITNIANLVPVDIATLINGQSSMIEGDSLYGINNVLLNINGEFAIGININGVLDLPRGLDGIGILGDIRNNENQIVSNVHLAFMQLHNKIFNEIKIANPSWTLIQQIDEAKKQVVYIIQWICAYDFVQKITSKYYSRLWNIDGTPKIHKEILKAGLKMPLEFAIAFRFGHSMVRDSYYINPAFDVLTVFNALTPGINDLSGFQAFPKDTTIDWSFWVGLEGFKGPQVADIIDGSIALTLATLPGSVIGTSTPITLHERTFLRSLFIYDVISGQDMARLMDITEDEIISFAKNNFVLKNHNLLNQPLLDMNALTKKFGNNTPLFLYLLKEAEVFSKGECLGPLGSALIGSCFLHFINNAPVNIFKDMWKPVAGQYGCIQDGIYDMTALISYIHNLPVTTYANVPTVTPLTRLFDQHSNVIGQLPTPGQILHPNGPFIIGAFPDIALFYISQNKFFPGLPFPPKLFIGAVPEILGIVAIAPTPAEIAAAQAIIDTVRDNAQSNGLRSDLAIFTFIIHAVILSIAEGLILPIDGPIINPIINPWLKDYSLYTLNIKDVNNIIVYSKIFIARNGERNNINIIADLSKLNVTGPLSYELITRENSTFLIDINAQILGN